ncbi:hypothetical protein QE369_003868 [Agrobacterium larrymoorei]|uniref:Uncharacterized protein n=1 Tax=Agrobacterium larrymoorei TaxID=160699 RepID=A0AAJ2BIK9_9HYPH|nr:hypothetical protein [Agrobacterium larrymoorei]MDR6103671.1 hypothetical protein [Agrobacterium larrymoorei]
MTQEETFSRPLNLKIEDPDVALKSHRCLSCLTGPLAEKRACARLTLLSEGFPEARIASLSPSFKTEH